MQAECSDRDFLIDEKQFQARWRFIGTIAWLRERRRALIGLLVIVLFLTIAFVDLVTFDEVHFFVFYLVPLFITALIFSRPLTFAAALASGLLGLLVNRVEGHFFPGDAHPHLLMNYLLVFAANIAAAAAFRLVLENLERSVSYEAFIRSILKNIPYGVITFSEHSTVLHVNPAAAGITGYPAGRLLGCPCGEVRDLLFPHGGGGAFLDLDTVRGGGGGSREYSVTLQDGSLLPIASTAAPIMELDRFSGAIEIFRDISREKELERYREELLSMLSHDLRTPLTVIVGYSELLKRSNIVDARRLEYAQSILVSARSMSVMIENVLEEARLNEGRAVYHCAEFELPALVSEVSALFEPLALERKITLEVSGDESIPVSADREKLRQVLNNLISNALKYAPAESTVELSATAAPGAAIIRVTDKGAGIPESFLPRLFDRFTQADGKKSGSGLGLYIARKIVEGHGGTIVVESRAGEGTAFTVTLPLSRA